MEHPSAGGASSRLGHYELTDLKTFQVVAECGSISKASRRMGTTKSVVSQRISRLERALGSDLFARSRRGVVLTDQGVLYLAQTAEALSLLEAAAESVANDPTGATGNLRISAPLTFATRFLGASLCQFLERHPNLHMQLELHDHQVDLHAEGFDLGIRISGRPPAGDVHVVTLASSRRVVCCSPSYAARHGLPHSAQELYRHQAIGYSNDSLAGLWSFPDERSSSVTPPSCARLVTNNGEMMRDAALQGLGLIAIPLFIVAEDLRSGRLLLVPTQDELRPDSIFAIVPSRKSRLVKVRLLLEHLKSVLSEHLPWETELPPHLRTF